MTEKIGALAGPETAAEHVRNAMQLMDAGTRIVQDDGDGILTGYVDAATWNAARARLARALAALEGTS